MERRASRGLIRRVQHERGQLRERAFLHLIETAIQEGKTPEWMTGVEAADEKSDRKGVDVWVHTDVGKIPLQVKSSQSGFDKASKKHPKIPIIVVDPGEPEVALSTSIALVEQKRIVYLQKRQRRESP